MAAATGFAPKAEISAFAFVAGFVDVVGFIALAGLFTAHVTGNLIMIGVEFAGGADGLWLKVLALPVFVAAVATVRLAEKRLLARGRDPVAPLVAVETALLLLFAAAGLWMQAQGGGAASGQAMLTGLLAVAAMAVQNALSRTSLAELGPTTIMTGNSTQVVIDIVDLFSATPETRPALHARLTKMVPSVASFALGAISGALLYTLTGFLAVALPVAVLAALSVSRFRTSQRVAAQG